MKKTLEEKLIVKIYDLTKQEGDFFSKISPEKVAEEMGIEGKKIKGIIRSLQYSNFIKIEAENLITLTSKGIKLAEEINS